MIKTECTLNGLIEYVNKLNEPLIENFITEEAERISLLRIHVSSMNRVLCEK
jgi:hypothetical protein